MRLLHANTQRLQEVLPSKACFAISTNQEARLNIVCFPLRIAVPRIDVITVFAHINYAGVGLEVTEAG